MHKFRLFEEKNVISEIKVVKPGSGYENRKLHVKPVGINTVHDKITFNNHGFNDGDVVYYSTSGTAISGLSTSNQYRVLKIDDNNFRLADAGSVNVSAAGTEYNRKNYVKLETTGTEYQTFAFPPVSLEINAEYIGAGNTITATPIVTGEIVDLYLYDEGTNYGSDVFNFHKDQLLKLMLVDHHNLKQFIEMVESLQLIFRMVVKDILLHQNYRFVVKEMVQN